MDYEKQYLKYKNKYLSLKKLASQRGGAATTPSNPISRSMGTEELEQYKKIIALMSQIRQIETTCDEKIERTRTRLAQREKTYDAQIAELQNEVKRLSQTGGATTTDNIPSRPNRELENLQNELSRKAEECATKLGKVEADYMDREDRLEQAIRRLQSMLYNLRPRTP